MLHLQHFRYLTDLATRYRFGSGGLPCTEYEAVLKNDSTGYHNLIFIVSLIVARIYVLVQY